ncbi:hypothetical protein [Empedobacter tilapiae]|uniref:Uncharacterized protein n=1 Tax=Empedobacter tilapiae TaxID=2491114 RepID=A0A4Z1B003_9FLAO|nr:hypothetical protein [Empedobacter tilapiae]TGN26283.1 hypothetical protein E4J94_10645 [Empedobacter tilapiae]
MKKIVLAFVLFPVLSFSQESINEKVLNRIIPSSISTSEYENNKPAYFIDGERVDKILIEKLNPSDIKYINVSKVDKQYPNGKIDIVSKKEKES